MEFLSNLSSNIGPLLQAIAIITGISAAIIAALITRNANINISRKKATIDLMVSENSKDHFDERLEYLDIVRNGELEKYASPEKFDSRERNIILRVLNGYESVCVGMKNNAYCEKTYRQWKRQALVNDWILLGTFVSSLRHKSSGDTSLMFEEFSRIAYRWATPDERKKISVPPRR